MSVRAILPSFSRALPFVALAACSGPSGKGPTGAALAPSEARTPYLARAVAAGGTVTSTDARGLPQLIWARERQAVPQQATAESMARRHFARFAGAYGVEGQAIQRVGVASVGRIPGGNYLARLRQQIDGVEVYRGDLKVVMRSDLSLVALSGSLSPSTGVKPPDRRFLLSPGDALGRALGHLYGTSVPAGTAVTAQAAITDPYVRLELQMPSPVRLTQPARAKKVYYPVGDNLVPAYFVEFFSSPGTAGSSDAYLYLVAADDGRVLERHDLVASESFNYRVFAQPTGEKRPLDGPISDYTPHPIGAPDGTDPEFVPSQLVAMESFKALPEGAVDPWLPAGATQTLGNNVDAYADRDGQEDGFTPPADIRAATTGAGTFDRAYDVTKEPTVSEAQVMAAIANLFYVTNWLHDYWYDSGFDEAAGNAQNDNFGRGGLGGDPLHVEAQDFGGTNNANMATPADGLPPRMQMYLWDAPELRSVVASPGGASFNSGGAEFGPDTFDLTAELVLAADGTAPATDACQDLTNNVAGKIVLIDRGDCSFNSKARRAQDAGAAGVLIANNEPGPPLFMGLQSPPLAVNIPSLSTTLDAGNALKAQLGQGTVTLHMVRGVVPPGRDGAIDNMIVAHEWGHYLHHRLSNCFTYQCAALSEGFADFTSLHLALKEGDDLDGTYGVAIYSPKIFGDTGYFGIRRFPYSVDFSKNALTFKHISAGVTLPAVPQNPIPAPNSEVHNAGEVWASMLFETYVAMQKNRGARSFEQTRRAFADLYVLALQLAPPSATYTDYRDSFLAAVEILDPDQFELVAQAFARRGAGTCAKSPPPDDQSLRGVTESFEVKPLIGETSIQLDDSVASCDDDGTLDARETGMVHVQVGNTGATVMTGAVVTLSSATEGVTFPDGPSVTLDDIPRLGSATGVVKIALDDTIAEAAAVAITVTVANAAACETSVPAERFAPIHRDETPESSRTEDVEALSPPWEKTGTGADAIWSRADIDEEHHNQHAWAGKDSSSLSDTALVTPPLQVSAAGNFRISFEHAYRFEFGDARYWDGGVIELSDDDGATWKDVEDHGADPGYNAAAIFDEAGNPLAGRRAYGRDSAGYPAMVPVTLDFGNGLAGKTVRVRFRIGTDEAVGADGWFIDNIAVEGIDNTPFTAVTANAVTCQVPPQARAGADQVVQSGVQVTLTGAATSDANGDPITYAWTQTGGTAVTLSDAGAVEPTFTAPAVTAVQDLTFQLQASDQGGSSTDNVVVRVEPAPGPPDAGAPAGGDGGGCGVAGGAGTGLPLALLGLALLFRRRRS